MVFTFHPCLFHQERGLLEDLGSRVDEDKGATSYERQQRNAERKHLRELRRDKRNTAVKRKVLKLEDQVINLTTNVRDMLAALRQNNFIPLNVLRVKIVMEVASYFNIFDVD